VFGARPPSSEIQLQLTEDSVSPSRRRRLVALLSFSPILCQDASDGTVIPYFSFSSTFSCSTLYIFLFQCLFLCYEAASIVCLYPRSCLYYCLPLFPAAAYIIVCLYPMQLLVLLSASTPCSFLYYCLSLPPAAACIIVCLCPLQLLVVLSASVLCSCL
jgi:hypothetical protein